MQDKDYTLDSVINDCFPKDGQDEDVSFHLHRIKKIQAELKKQEGNLTCRVLLRALNCEYNDNKVSIPIKELFYWFETGQHLKEWKEVDTL